MVSLWYGTPHAWGMDLDWGGRAIRNPEAGLCHRRLPTLDVVQVSRAGRVVLDLQLGDALHVLVSTRAADQHARGKGT